MKEFYEDSKQRLQWQLEDADGIKNAVRIEEIKDSVFIPKMVPIPYDPPKSTWTDTSRFAFLKQFMI